MFHITYVDHIYIHFPLTLPISTSALQPHWRHIFWFACLFKSPLSSACAIQTFLEEGHSLKCDWLTRRYSFEENRFLLPRKLTIIHSSSVQGMVSWPLSWDIHDLTLGRPFARNFSNNEVLSALILLPHLFIRTWVGYVFVFIK